MPPLDIAACEAVGKWTKANGRNNKNRGTKPGAIEGEKVNVTSNKGRRCLEEELRRPEVDAALLPRPSGCLSKFTLVHPTNPHED
jgi:hypothetical protein